MTVLVIHSSQEIVHVFTFSSTSEESIKLLKQSHHQVEFGNMDRHFYQASLVVVDNFLRSRKILVLEINQRIMFLHYWVRVWYLYDLTESRKLEPTYSTPSPSFRGLLRPNFGATNMQ